MRLKGCRLLVSPHLNWVSITNQDLVEAFRLSNFHLQVTTLQGAEACKSFPTDPLFSDVPLEALQKLSSYPVTLELEQLPGEQVDNKNAQRLWLHRLALIYRKISAQIEEVNPHALLIVQGHDPIEAVARILAVEKGVPMLSLENTAITDRLLWDDCSGVTVNRNQARSYFWKHVDLLTREEARSYASSLWGSLKKRKSDEHKSPSKDYRKEQPYVLFIGQVYTDSSVVHGIGNWKTPVNLLKHLLDAVSEMPVVAKLHPKELTGKSPITRNEYRSMTWRKIREDTRCQNAIELGKLIVDHRNEYDTYSLIEQADVVVTLNSQAGLEAAMIGKPVILCGDAFYGGLGFTYEVRHPENLATTLRVALRDGATAPDTASSFVQIFYENYCLAKNANAVRDKLVSLVANGTNQQGR